MAIKVTEEMRQAALNELVGEQNKVAAALELENIQVPGQVKPGWEEISADLSPLLTPAEEDMQHES